MLVVTLVLVSTSFLSMLATASKRLHKQNFFIGIKMSIYYLIIAVTNAVIDSAANEIYPILKGCSDDADTALGQFIHGQPVQALPQCYDLCGRLSR
jgi:hypothetical protein